MSLNKLKITLQYIMPKHALSRLVGKFAVAEAGWLTTKAISAFIKSYGINMQEAKYKNASDFKTFNDFFTRELEEGARPILQDANTICYPVDGAISQQGEIRDGQLIQAKGFDYSLITLLGGDKETAQPFQNGAFSCIYLAPKDYHRIHMPMAATLREMIYVPGDLFSVNPLTANNVPNLFARNERVVTIFDTEYGPMSMTLVGATIVASIETTWAGTITPPAGKDVFRWQYPASGTGAITFNKGDEMGRFKLGSTVITTFAPQMIKFNQDAGTGTVTRLGEHYADLIGKNEN
ncbi:archaetidylserine decarboxylase [Thalassotalea profundi]|uniref:Phosphatidylserine decarboxylase proenzyme n=1 Tax=Thalassotalea profundi TaxID=2036687 RepID=A0ABQ3ISR0_9GAMM|nr:archaetidylserine decarboxylase [Thalassotalea profundi]GHE89713.1 phosphatidylserine decarboxylase proenzyme [Thalassotalea profundi]